MAGEATYSGEVVRDPTLELEYDPDFTGGSSTSAPGEYTGAELLDILYSSHYATVPSGVTLDQYFPYWLDGTTPVYDFLGYHKRDTLRYFRNFNYEVHNIEGLTAEALEDLEDISPAAALVAAMAEIVSAQIPPWISETPSSIAHGTGNMSINTLAFTLEGFLADGDTTLAKMVTELRADEANPVVVTNKYTPSGLTIEPGYVPYGIPFGIAVGEEYDIAFTPTYSATEISQLRERFGVTDLTANSAYDLYKTKIEEMARDLVSTTIGRTATFKVVSSSPIKLTELSALTTTEGAPGITLEATTVTIGTPEDFGY